MRIVSPAPTGRRPIPYVLIVVLVLAALAAITLWAQRDAADDRTVRVKDFRPQNTTDPRTNITITFSRPLVPADSLDRPLTNPPVQFDPPLAGVARFIDTDVLRFFPDQPLRPATAYAARVASDRLWADGRRIADDRRFTFRTEPLSVTSVSTYATPAEDRPGNIRLYTEIRFNYPVNVDDLLRRITITAKSNAAVSGDLEFGIFSTTNTQASIESLPLDASGNPTVADIISIATGPFPSSDAEQTYLMTIAAGVDCPDCGQPLQNNYTADLIAPRRERFIIHSAESQTVGVQASIVIYLSAPTDPDRAKDFVTVNPPVDFRLEQEWSSLIVRAAFVPGESYTVAVDAGLPSQTGAVLENDFSARVTIRDFEPTVIFRSQGTFLPAKSSGLLEVETINLDTLTVDVEHIFANNLVYALAGNHAAAGRWGNGNTNIVGHRWFTAKKALESEKNQKLSTTIDLGAIIGDTARGIFKITARNASAGWARDSRLAMRTDLGISARMSGDYLLVWINRLSTVEPVSGADVTLYSRNNQVLLSGRTDSRGAVEFRDIAARTEGFEPFVITAESDGDLSYLRFSETLIDLSDFDIKGRPFLNRGYEAFVYTDRGVYRPGETVRLAAIVRGPDGAVPDDFPYFLNVKDPAGRDFQTFRLNTGKTAFAAVDLSVPEFARTGKYTVIARIGDSLEIGRADLQIEEFLPDRIKVAVSTPRAAYALEEKIPISVASEFLFGPPAAHHQVSGGVQIENHNFTDNRFSKYSFTDSQRKFISRTDKLPEATLNADGRHTYTYTLSGPLTPPSALKALVGTAVSEQGGRAVSGYAEILIHPYPRYVGVHLGFEGYAKPGEPFSADLIALLPDGRTVAVDKVDARLYRVVYNSVLTRDGRGNYRYKSERSETLMEEKTIALPADGAAVQFVPPDQGEYRLAVFDPLGGHSADVSLYASGWGYAPWSMKQPERIEVGLDRESYQPGDNAVVQIRAPFAGKLIVTVENQSVLETTVLDMSGNTADVGIKVRDSFFPNVYVTATVIRKADDVDGTTPARAFGMAPLFLSKSKRDLNVSLDAPDVMKPRQTLTVGINVGVAGTSLVTVAAVDAGILQLTGFTTPDPLEFFYGQRAPALRPYDLYSFLYPNIRPSASHLAPGGDRFFDSARRRHLNPFAAARVTPLALWSGLVTTASDGRATVSFDIPRFNGRIVVMAVAAQKNRFGAASREIIVRENLIVQESFPRFVGPNDRVVGLATIFNHSGEKREITAELELTGPAEAVGEQVQRITLPDNGEGSVAFHFRAGLEPGAIGVRIRATSGIDQTEVAFDLPNRPAQPLVTRYGSGILTDTIAARFTTPSDFVPRTTRFVLQTSSLSAVQFRKNIDYLLRYPYGCIEQTVSRLFPLLYFDALARFADPRQLGGNSADYFIREGILRVQGMARDDGTFSFWPDGKTVNPWASVYAGHFLLEARQAGYAVDDETYNRVLQRLTGWARGRDLTDNDAPVRTYAAYALASVQHLDRKVLNELRRIPVASLPLDAKFHLAGAFALAGDRSAAFAIIDPIDIQPADFAAETGGNFSSGVRTNAIMLDVLSRIEPSSPSAAVLAKSLTDGARLDRWFTTQENAFALMALGRYLKGRTPADFNGRVHIGGDTALTFTSKDFSYTRENFVGRDVALEIDGAGPCFYFWQLSGVPTAPAAEEFTRGISVKREYLDADGGPLPLDRVALGQQVVCRLEVKSVRDHLENVVINDLLPAGFAIENPRLKTSPRLSWIPREEAAIDHADIRDDRILLFAGLAPNRPLVYHYSLRAVSAGEFVIPPVAAECMYNPAIAGASSTGRLTVVSPK